MPLIACPECQSPISTQARACPKCGYADRHLLNRRHLALTPRARSANRIVIYLIVLALALLYLGYTLRASRQLDAYLDGRPMSSEQ